MIRSVIGPRGLRSLPVPGPLRQSRSDLIDAPTPKGSSGSGMKPTRTRLLSWQRFLKSERECPMNRVDYEYLGPIGSFGGAGGYLLYCQRRNPAEHKLFRGP